MIKKQWIFPLIAFLVLSFFVNCGRQPEKAAIHYERAREFYAHYQLDSVMTELKLALKADRKNVPANLLAIRIRRFDLYEYREVREEYLLKAKKYPIDPVYQYLASQFEFDGDKLEVMAKTVLDAHPGSYYGYCLLGKACSRQDLDDDALEAYQKAVAIDLTKTDAYQAIASIQSINQDYEAALSSFKKILELDPAAVEGYGSIWYVEYEMARDKETARKKILNEMETILAKYPDHIQFLDQLRWGFARLEETERAEEIKQKLYAADKTGRFQEYDALQEIYRGRTPETRIEAAEAFLAKYPDSKQRSSAYTDMFYSLQRKPDMPKEKIFKLINHYIDEPDHGALSSFLPFMLNSKLFTDEDIEAVGDKWFARYPEDSDGYNTIAWEFYLNRSDKLEKAVAYAQKAVDFEKDDPMKAYYLDTRGWAEYKLKRFNEAVTTLEKANALYQEFEMPDYEIRHHLGAACLATGNADSALSHLGYVLTGGENPEVEALYMDAYEKKFGSRDGAREHLVKMMLAHHAVKEPFQAPEFTLVSLRGGDISLADHIGKVVLVNFWKPG